MLTAIISHFEIDEDNNTLLRFSYLFTAEDDLLPISERSGDFYVGDYSRLPGFSLLNNSLKYLKAERIPPEHNYKANLNAVQKQNFLGYRGEHTSLYIALNKFEPIKIESVKHPDATSNTLIAHLDAWMNEITPGTHVISTYYTELDIVRLSYQFDDGDDVTPEFSPVKCWLWLYLCIAGDPRRYCPAKKGDLVIIENPESHLHPQGQAKLGELFAKAANDGVQLIIESHSDHLLNGIRVAVKKRFCKKRGCFHILF